MSGGEKIPFTVIQCSSHDDGFDARELETTHHNPHTKGWQAARFCEYPQQLILQFDRLYDVRKIQILSHQSKISTSIEVFVGRTPNGNGDINSCLWDRLGYLSLDSNERSGYKARELKSVYVNARGSFLKLHCKKCHVNTINLFNQVGVVAVNIVGTPALGTASVDVRRAQGNDASLVEAGTDDKTAMRLRELARRKQQAIEREDYDEAKKLKSAITGLKQIGSRISELERRKREAVEREDYDRAKQIKREIDRLRGGRGEGREDPRSYRNGGGGGGRYDRGERRTGRRGYERRDERTPQRGRDRDRDRERHHAPESAHRGHTRANDRPGHNSERPLNVRPQEQDFRSDPQERPINPARDGGGGGGGSPLDRNERPLRGAPQQKQEAAPQQQRPEMDEEEAAAFRGNRRGVGEEERPLNMGRQQQPSEEEAQGGLQGQGGLPAPEPLTAAQRKDTGELVRLFGEHHVTCLHSRNWALREFGLNKVLEDVEGNALDASDAQLFPASCQVLRLALGDKVAKVFLVGCDLLRLVVDGQAGNLPKDAVRQALDPCVEMLVAMLGDSNAHKRTAAKDSLVFMAFHQNLDSALVGHVLLRPLKPKDKDKPLPIRHRAECLTQLIQDGGLNSKHGLSPDSVIKFAKPHLEHRDKSVRDAVTLLIVECHKQVGPRKVATHLKDLNGRLKEMLEAQFQAGPDAGGPDTPTAQALPARSNQSPVNKKKKKSPAKEEPTEEDDGELQGFCQFCGLEDPTFTDETLDLHYWKDCTMLTSCKQCEQVIEIATLNEHILTECEVTGTHKECPRCKEPVPTKQFAKHTAKYTCNKARSPNQANRCPLCHKDIPPGEEGWKEHLTAKGCTENPRST